MQYLMDFVPMAVVVAVLLTPSFAAVALGTSLILRRPLAETTTTRLVQCVIAGSLATLLAVATLMVVGGLDHWSIPIVDRWIDLPHYHLSLKLLLDPLSLTYAILSLVLCGTIGAFAAKYLHREPGFHRFFLLYLIFVLGMSFAALAGTIETLFAGWELVGLSSALLVAFFHERLGPVRNGLRVWAIYRTSDAALLIAAILLHHLHGEGDFDLLIGHAAWPAGDTHLSTQQALLVGGLLLFAAAGKSALVPFCGWLPRAMEGPTPSSAIFYGAISVHLGAYLLLRVESILDVTPILGFLTVALGLATAWISAQIARVQTDIKSALSFASLTQVGLIVAEIGLGLRYLALLHLVGHASLRTLQFLRAPNLLQDHRSIENAIGGSATLPNSVAMHSVFQRHTISWYRFAWERAYLDSLLDGWIVEPFLRLFRFFTRVEAILTRCLSGTWTGNSERKPGDSREVA